MARVLIETQSWMPVEIPVGNRAILLTSEPVHLANTDGTAATTWDAQVGGTSTTADQTTDNRGVIVGRWIEEGEYDETVRGITKRVAATGPPSFRSLGRSNGSDDTVTLNGHLAAAGHLKGRPGETYLISTPLTIPSNTTLDLTNCTLKLNSGSNCNLIQNAAVGTMKRTLGAAMTAASATLTIASDPLSTTFAVGDVGKAITVQGAGAAGVPLKTTVSGFTNSTTVTLTDAAVTTVSGQYAAIGTRDSKITIIGNGGNIDRQNNGVPGSGKQWDCHIIRLRHVDDVKLKDVRVSSSAVGTKYGISLADCTDFTVDKVDADIHYSDLVHISGPAAHGSIRDVIADTLGDDLVSFTARDSTSVITDTAGDISDVKVDTAVFNTNLGTAASALKVVAGRTTDNVGNYQVKIIDARRLAAPNGTSHVCYVGDTSLGIITDLTIDSVRSLGGNASNVAVYLNSTTINNVTLRHIVNDPGDKAGIELNAVTSNTITIDDAQITGGAANTGGIVMVDQGCTITRLNIRSSYGKFANGGVAVVNIQNGVSPKSSITNVTVTDTYFECAAGSGAAVVRNQDALVTLTTVELCNYTSANSNYALGFYGGTTTVMATNVRSYGAALSSWLRAGAAAVVTVYADNIQGTLDGVTIDAGGAVGSKSFGFPIDVGTTGLTKTNGDAAYNTNAARSCGLGMVVSNGTNWKGVYSGATF